MDLHNQKCPKRNNQYNYQLLIGSNSSKLLSEHISKFEIYLSSLKKKDQDGTLILTHSKS